MISHFRIGASNGISRQFYRGCDLAISRTHLASCFSRHVRKSASRTISCQPFGWKANENRRFASGVCGLVGLSKWRNEKLQMSPSPQICPAHSQSSIPNTGRGSEASSSASASTKTGSPLLKAQHHRIHPSFLPPVHARGFRSTPFSRRLAQHHWSQHIHSRCLSVAAVIDRDAQLPRLLEGEDAEVGLLVEFRKANKTGLALITEKDGKRNWKAIDSRGTVHSLRPREIAFVLPGNEYKQDDLHRIQQLAESKAGDKSIMQEAWEIMEGEKDSFLSVPEMADLLFNNTSSAYCYASHRLLNEDRTYFKQVGRLPPRFAARPEAEVQAIKGRQAAELKRAEQRLEEQRARATAFRTAMATAYGLKPTEAEWLASPWGEEIRALKAYALQEQDPEAPFTFPEALMDVVKPFTGGALRAPAVGELLKQLGVWGLHEHLPLLRAGLTEEFPQSVMAEAAALIASPLPDPDADHRVDLTHLQSFAVDSADTKEVDDAISLERLADGGVKLWVHIADPTRWVALGSALEKEAARRALTLYLPTGNVPMFPRQLSEKVFSFQDGQPSLAFSIWMQVGETGDLLDCGATSSRVVATRMTYAQLNQRLAEGSDADGDILQLHKVAELRRQWRHEQGAMTLQFPDSTMIVSDPRSANPTISVKRDDVYETPANLFVSELMIMANEAVGKLGAVRSLPLPYRGQAEMVPLTSEEVAATPEGICRALLIRTKLTRSVMTVGAPLPHHSLGLAAYVQATSPIRRYSDLLVHWQLKAVLRGEQPPLPADPLSELVNESSLKAREYKIQDRDITRYWQTLYFQRELQANPHKLYGAMLATWIKQESGAGLAVLSDSYITVRVWLAQPYPLGTKLQLLCAEADPFNAQLTFREAAAPPPELASQPGSEQPDASEEISDSDSQLA